MSKSKLDIRSVDSTYSAIWGHHISLTNTPEGFTLRTTYPTYPNGVEVMLEQGEDLMHDGEPLILNKGDVGYIKAGRIEAKYIESCKLVYVHDKAFGFVAEG